jgi:hypothetical protein
LDEHDKPRAARFSGDQLDLVNKAAALMHLHVVKVTSPEMAEIAQKLPAGRLYSNGRGFVPFVRRELYAKLMAAAAGRKSGSASTASPVPLSHGLPPGWDRIANGHLVIALDDSAPGEGWWQAIVIETVGDMLTLKWRQFPRLPKFKRHRLAVALLDPNLRREPDPSTSPSTSTVATMLAARSVKRSRVPRNRSRS